jgi:hypothetical protein
MNCAVCGADNEAGAKFCYRCGSSLQASNPAATGPTVNLNQQPAATADLPADARISESSARVYESPAEPPYTINVPSQPQYMSPASGPARPQYTVTQQQSNSALISMILGIVAILLYLMLLCTIFLPPLSAAAGIPALLLGYKARQEISASGGQLTGGGMAVAGMVLGSINIVLCILSVCGIIGLFAMGAQGM